MILDAVQLLALALIIVGVWLTAPLGVSLILSGMILLGAALFVEQHT